MFIQDEQVAITIRCNHPAHTQHVTYLIDMNELTVRHYFHPLMRGHTSVKKVCDAVWQESGQIRARLQGYIRNAGEKFLSPYEALPSLVIVGRSAVVAEDTGAKN